MTLREDARQRAPVAGLRVPGWLERALARAHVTLADLAIVVALTAVATLMRLWQLDSIPQGLHGDEAWTGIDARRVLDEGWIGPYVESALGQPTGPVYFTALLFTFLPETTFTLRLSMAVFGVATIPLAYATFALMFNRTTGVLASVFLGTMMWHLHLGRTGFMVITWPFIEVAALGALWLAMRRGNPWLYVAAGAITGAGVHTYNAYLTFLPLPFFALAWTVLAARGRRERIRAASGAVAFVAAGLLVALPLMYWASQHWDTYRDHQRVVAVTSQPEWEGASLAGKTEIIWDRAVEWHNGLLAGDRPDLGDGLAAEGYPPLHVAVYVLALAGAVIALLNARRLEYALCVLALLVMPWGAFLTVGDGLFRRTLGITPFIAALAALPLARLWDVFSAQNGARATAGIALVLFAPALVGMDTTYRYFAPLQDTETMRLVYPYQLDAAAHWMDGLPDDAYVYFYSDRWSIGYETVRFIAPDVAGEDRSREFSGTPGDEPLDTSNAQRGERPVAFVLLGNYLDALDEIRERHEGGRTVAGVEDGEVLFRAYYLPARE